MNHYIWIFNNIPLYILGGSILSLIIIEIYEIVKEETNFLKTYGSRFICNIKN
nr:MAG TPA: hypothetical protein [Caudoviricetes sp.]